MDAFLSQFRTNPLRNCLDVAIHSYQTLGFIPMLYMPTNAIRYKTLLGGTVETAMGVIVVKWRVPVQAFIAILFLSPAAQCMHHQKRVLVGNKKINAADSGLV